MKANPRRKRIGITALVVIALAILAGSYLRIVDSYELETLDLRFLIRGSVPASDKIAIVEIGDDTIRKLGRFPFDRSYHTLLIKAISDSGGAIILFDLFFSEPSDGDAELESAIAKAGNVYFPVPSGAPICRAEIWRRF